MYVSPPWINISDCTATAAISWNAKVFIVNEAAHDTALQAVRAAMVGNDSEGLNESTTGATVVGWKKAALGTALRRAVGTVQLLIPESSEAASVAVRDHGFSDLGRSLEGVDSPALI